MASRAPCCMFTPLIDPAPGKATRRNQTNMDWQQLSALAIVAITAGLFLRIRLRPRKPFESGGSCGCHAPEPGDAQKQRIIFKARKGERPRIVVKN